MFLLVLLVAGHPNLDAGRRLLLALRCFGPNRAVNRCHGPGGILSVGPRSKHKTDIAMKWALKIAAKMLMIRLPIPYAYWKSIGVFRHGRMDSVDYPLKVFKLHAERAYPHGFPPRLAILELGPGDSVASAIIGYAHGVARTYLIDVGAFARKDVAFYQRLAADLKKRGMNAPDLSRVTSFGEVLHICRAEYLIDDILGLDVALR